MSDQIGATAVVIGAGMGGLSAAAVLAGFFKQVIVLERDELSDQVRPRTGIPQGKHAHAILASGLGALTTLLPGLDKSLLAAGAVPVTAGLDLLVERPGFDPFPQRDMGWQTVSASRPMLEVTVRQHVARLPQVQLRPHCTVQDLIASPDGQAVLGITLKNADGQVETLHTDLVVDASGRAAPTLAFLSAHGHALPEESSIGVDMAYASCVFAMPHDAPSHWKALMHMPDMKAGALAGLLLPIEGRRWLVSIGAAHGGELPADYDSFMTCVQSLRTPTLYEALRHAERESEIARFAFPASIRRHVERLTTFPRGLLPLGDSICRFNPIYGQGMSVAATQAVALQGLLRDSMAQGNQPHALNELAPAFFQAVQPLLETPWAVANMDFVYPQTRGERPADLEMTLRFVAALTRVAAREPAVHKVMLQVQHLMRPRSAYQDPAVMPLVLAEMAAMAAPA
jgi:2-polyprenyl-6-methoxyphenol hydroxylase-like FAD-dependent oxidoreductase